MELVFPPLSFFGNTIESAVQDNHHNVVTMQLNNRLRNKHHTTLCIQLILTVYVIGDSNKYRESGMRNKFESVNMVGLLLYCCFEAPSPHAQLKCQNGRSLVTAFFGFVLPTF